MTKLISILILCHFIASTELTLMQFKKLSKGTPTITSFDKSEVDDSHHLCYTV
jgi:hypothetical protein